MWLHRFLFRSQHNTLPSLGIELDKSLARVAAAAWKSRALEAEARVAELEKECRRARGLLTI